tara:strand:- start:4186 stop:5502 length:1317 start_codon:yes stop_codon:yes gene_type:complete
VNVALLRALRIIARADSDPARQALFERVSSRTPSMKLALRAHRLLGDSNAGAALILGYGVGEYLKASLAGESPRDGLLGLGIYPTDRSALDYVARLVGAERVGWIKVSPAPQRVTPQSTRQLLSRFARGRRRRRLLRLARLINRRYGFLVACRLTATVAWRLRSAALLAEAQPRAVLVTSDYHPEPIGLVAAARAAGLPVIFVTHAHPHRLCPPLEFDLAILDGEAALSAYERLGPARAEIVFRGVEGESRPLEPERLLQEHPVIGLFPPKEIRWEVFARLIEEARARFQPARFLIRWHPNMLEGSRLGEHLADLSDLEVTPQSLPLAEVVGRCTWALGEESSNVHLGTLKVGVPSIPLAGLAVTVGGSDYYGFIADGVLPPAVDSLEELSLEDTVAFYGAPDWPERFRRYDASYLQPREAMDAAVAAQVLAHLGWAP